MSIKSKIISFVLMLLFLCLSGCYQAKAESVATPTDLDPAQIEYTIYYHESEDSPVLIQKSVVLGIGEIIPDFSDLDIQENNRCFLGWKAYRDDEQKWLMELAQGKRKWYTAKASDFGLYTYALLQAGESFDEEVVGGAGIHFYAQWKYFNQEDSGIQNDEGNIEENGSKSSFVVVYFHEADYAPILMQQGMEIRTDMIVPDASEVGILESKRRFLG